MRTLFGFLGGAVHDRDKSKKNHRNARRASLKPCLEILEDRLQPSAAGISGLGAAGQFAVLAIHGGDIVLTGAKVSGDLGLGPNEHATLTSTQETGTLYEDPTATLRAAKSFHASGGNVKGNLAQAVADADSASAAYAALPSTQKFTALTKSTTISGNGATNVISLQTLDYSHQTLTLQGGPNDVFILNIAKDFRFHSSKIVLSGGVTADHVLFNLAGEGAGIDIRGANSVLQGTLLAPHRSVTYHHGTNVDGAVVAKFIFIHAHVNLSGITFTPPSSLSGYVYDDTNNNGVKDPQEVGLGGVLVSLISTDNLGNTVHLTQRTDANGFYSFTGLRPGKYTLSESQPLGFIDGKDSIGSQGGTVVGHQLNLTLNAGINGVNNNFGELFAGSGGGNGGS
jgi:hypothetical protein